MNQILFVRKDLKIGDNPIYFPMVQLDGYVAKFKIVPDTENCNLHCYNIQSGNLQLLISREEYEVGIDYTMLNDLPVYLEIRPAMRLEMMVHSNVDVSVSFAASVLKKLQPPPAS